MTRRSDLRRARRRGDGHTPIFLLALACLLALNACSPPPTTPGPTPGTPVVETVPPDGATLVATDLAGNTITVEFPPGAVPEATEVTVTPREAPPGAWAGFELEPRGARLAVPAVLTLAAAPGRDVTGSGLRFGSGVEGSAIPTVVDPGTRTLRAEVTSLGYPDEAVELSRQQAGGLAPLIARQIACDIELSSLRIRFERARLFPFSSSLSAKRLADQIAAFVDDCATLEPDYDALIDTIRRESCSALNDAEADTAVLPPSTRDELLDLTRNVMRWATQAAASSADCAATESWRSSVDAMFRDFVDRYRAKVNDSGHLADYDEHWNDLRLGALPLLGDAMTLGLGEGESLVTELIADLLDALRGAGYRVCLEERTQSLLANIYTSGEVRSVPVRPPPTVPLLTPQAARGPLVPIFARYSEAEIEADMQLCGTRVTVEVWNLTDSFPEHSVTVEGGATPGAHERSAETLVPVEGQLELAGELWAMDGPSGPDGADLVLELDGVEVERWSPSGANFPLGQARLHAEAMLGAIGISPDDQNAISSPSKLVFTREGEACGGDYGPADYELFTAEMQFDPAPDVTSAASANPASIPADTATPISFGFPFEDSGENIVKVIGRFSLEGDLDVITLEWTADGPEVSGLSGSGGTATVSTTAQVLCSEKGKNPITVELSLEDEFGQRGDSGTTTFTVDYGGC